MFIVVATSHDAARRAARRAAVDYEELPAVLTAAATRARANRIVLPPMQLARGDARGRLRVPRIAQRGEMLLGGQEQFYLEGQIAYAVPKDDDGMHVYCSTQHPTEMQHLVAHALDVASHNVLVECRRMGGGFGGKESQSALFACCAALAAWKLLCPVKLRPDRDDDMMVTGKRHDFHYTYEVGYRRRRRDRRRAVDMTSRCGFSADLSGPVMTRASATSTTRTGCPTSTSTAIAARPTRSRTPRSAASADRKARSAIEYIIDNVARSVGMDSLDVRRRNLYGKTRAQRHAVWSDGRGQRHPRTARRA